MLNLLPPIIIHSFLNCGSKWTVEDLDGDGFTVEDGDCWDTEKGPEGSALTGFDIHPDATDTWYDGIDQNCSGDSDFDADADGYVPKDEYVGVITLGVPDSDKLLTAHKHSSIGRISRLILTSWY